MFDENVLNEIKKDPKLVAQLTGIPEEVIEKITIRIPSQPGAEFKELMLSITKSLANKVSHRRKV